MSKRLKVYIGTMFGGKTENMLTEANIEANHVKGKVFFFKPNFCNRHAPDKLRSHNGTENKTDIISVDQKNPIKILDRVLHNSDPVNEDVNVFIDEIQFFSSEITEIALKLLDLGCNLSVAGLQTDYRGEPFETTSWFVAHANEIVQKHARCTHPHNNKVCGKTAIYNQRFDKTGKPITCDEERFKVGAGESYAPRCREHFVRKNK